ncbi:MAG TPA: flavoprotein, partial [Thermoanaerobaculia bacterium]|nr:flavoprotein [Thermoanaerobaculia bacterium]
MIGERPHLAILGAGPAGLDAALEAAARCWGFTLYEAAGEPAGNVRSWGHVSLFSPWSIDASPRMRRALAARGTEIPDDDACPTGRELAGT